MTDRLPNLLIIGVFKAGTTSLFHYLNQHPQICGATKKETHFFSPIVFSTGEVESIDKYKSFFSNCKGEKYILEASPSYLYGGDKLISSFESVLPPNHKIILILRNPAERFISYFKFIKTRSAIPPDETLDYFIDRCIEEDNGALDFRKGTYANAVKEGRYANYLKKWIKKYNRENFFICFFEDLSNSRKLVKEIAAWLGIDGSFYDNFHFTIENKTVAPRFHTIHKVFVKLNKRGEDFFRRNPRLKRSLRSFYYLFNKKRSVDNVDLAEKKRLDELYKASNAELKELLDQYGVKNLPKWLTA